ncbi:kinesin, putative, partial [Bodo saltans]
MTCPDDEGAAPATQVQVYNDIGRPLIDSAFGGYNSCLFAYGQTGSGKTHTMMGGGSFDADHPDAGVIPRLCKDLFIIRQTVQDKGACRWCVEVGFVEVYNEKVSDLLADRKKDAKGKPLVGEDVYLEVREHPQRGVFVEGQTFRPVDGAEDIASLIDLGNNVRHVAATKMNNRSSRSHAIFQILLREERLATGTVGKSSRMNLVDLAGSERVSQSQVVGQQFNEAKFINLSLTTLGRVIDILADMAKKEKGGMSVPPYRESKLTYLLKDSLGGNSKTFMIAAVSPSAMNYEESMSTLRYASRARDIVNTAKMNEDPRAKRIRELEERIANMQAGVTEGGVDPAVVSEMENRIRMMQSEAQQQIAELQTLRLEREKAEMSQQLHKATQEEKMLLQAKADELELQMRQSRAQSEFHVKEMERLRVEREDIEEKVRLQHAEMETMQRQISEMRDGQEQLKRTMADLDRAEQTKQEALRELEAQKRALDSALQRSEQSQEERAALEKRNDELAARIRQAEEESANGARIRLELQAVQKEMDLSKHVAQVLTTQYEEAEARRFHTETSLTTYIELLLQSSSFYASWASDEILALRIDKENVTQRLQLLADDLESTQERTKHTANNFEQQITALTTQLEALTAERDAVTAELTAATTNGDG